MSLNHIVLMGRMVKDPELKQTQSGVSVCNFTIAVDRDYKNGDEKVADFVDCVVWRNSADFVAKYMKKGRMVTVSGSLQSRKWRDKEGNNRTSWEVQAQNVYFADSKRDGDSSSGGGSPAPASPDVTYEELNDAALDGELPF